jgi:hypothetical protein
MKPILPRSAALVLGAAVLALGGRATSAAMVPYSGSATTFTAPATGLYQITATGGGGGDDDSNLASGETLGGDGAVVTGTFSLVSGEELDILVGGQGGSAGDEPGNGGLLRRRPVTRNAG